MYVGYGLGREWEGSGMVWYGYGKGMVWYGVYWIGWYGYIGLDWMVCCACIEHGLCFT